MIGPSPLTTRRNGNSNEDGRNQQVAHLFRDTFVPGTSSTRERRIFRMSIQNECIKRVSFEFMPRCKAPLPGCEAIWAMLKFVIIYAPQLDSQRPSSFAEARLEKEASGPLNHQTVESFCATIGLRPIRRTHVMCQRPLCTDSSWS